MKRSLLLIAAMWTLTTTAHAQSQQTLAGIEAYNRGDIATAYQLLHAEADAGDSQAQVNLGYLYARGQGVKADQREAFRLYTLSAAQGDSEGMNALGYKYQFGTGIPRDLTKAIYWYCQAVAYGNPRALNSLALILDRGVDLPRDIAEARNLWEQSAALGHSTAMYNLALSYLGHGGADVDRVAATQWMLRAAQAGFPQAQTVMRSNGYKGPLPPAFDSNAGMVPSPPHAEGHSKVCGGPIS